MALLIARMKAKASLDQPVELVKSPKMNEAGGYL